MSDGVRVGSLLGDREGRAVGASVEHVEGTMEGGLVAVGDEVDGIMVDGPIDGIMLVGAAVGGICCDSYSDDTSAFDKYEL